MAVNMLTPLSIKAVHLAELYLLGCMKSVYAIVSVCAGMLPWANTTTSILMWLFPGSPVSPMPFSSPLAEENV